MSEDRNSYRSITKSIGIFGGTKIFQILVGIIKNKAVAILLGPLGMGISGMITTATSMVSAFTGLGLHTSAVRDVAQSHATGDFTIISKTVSILRELVLITGLLGMLLVFALARYLSVLTFGDDSYTFAFQLVSVILLLDQIVVGDNVILQGTFHYKYMAKASLISSIVGLLFSLPIYYIWRINAIVPVIILSSLVNLLITAYYARKVKIPIINLSVKEILIGGKIMIVLGFAIALSGMVGMGKIYIERNFLVKIGSLEVVGLYTAGTAIVTQYVNVIFQAMGSDYTPRLSAISNNMKLFVEAMNRQILLLITLLSPLILIFIIFVKELVLLLYSKEFLPIMGMIEWMMMSMLFRALSWSISYGFSARGEAKIFFYNELLTSIYSIVFTIIGYKYLSYEGIGLGFLLTYLLYTIQVYFLGKKKFSFTFSLDVKKKSFPMIALTLGAALLIKYIEITYIKFLVGLTLLSLVSYISYRFLDSMLDLKSVFTILKSKIKKI